MDNELVAASIRPRVAMRVIPQQDDQIFRLLDLEEAPLAVG